MSWVALFHTTSIEISKEVSLKLILKGKGGIYTVYDFFDSTNLRVEISSKKSSHQRKGASK